MERLQILEKELKMIKNRTLDLELDLIHKVKQQNMSVNNLVNQNRNELEVNLLQRININIGLSRKYKFKKSN